jgi:hypothetical protein
VQSKNVIIIEKEKAKRANTMVSNLPFSFSINIDYSFICICLQIVLLLKGIAISYMQNVAQEKEQVSAVIILAASSSVAIPFLVGSVRSGARLVSI